MLLLKQSFYILFLLPLFAFGQLGKGEYLSKNYSTLDTLYTFPENDALIVGFGAFHGSAKTEDAELYLFKSIINTTGVDFYFPETDISIAHFFNEYLKNGDEVLLKDLIIQYGVRVPQERTIEVFNKWTALKQVYDSLPASKKFKVLGADPVVTYKYTYRHLLSLISNTNNWNKAKQLQQTVALDTTDYSPYYNSYAKRQLMAFVEEYDAHSERYKELIIDLSMFNYLIRITKNSFLKYNREEKIFHNYMELSSMFSLQSRQQFFRLGFAHLLKSKEDNRPSFFSMLIENHVYKKEQVISVLGYLWESEVLWDDEFDKDGNYISSVSLGEEGIGDGPNEYFMGIDQFKKWSQADLSIFSLNNSKSPYTEPGCIDLIEIITKGQPSGINYTGTSTTDFTDYAILIRNSKAATSIHTLMDN